jgi:hypothetical protein
MQATSPTRFVLFRMRDADGTNQIDNRYLQRDKSLGREESPPVPIGPLFALIVPSPIMRSRAYAGRERSATSRWFMSSDTRSDYPPSLPVEQPCETTRPPHSSSQISTPTAATLALPYYSDTTWSKEYWFGARLTSLEAETAGFPLSARALDAGAKT